MILLLLACLNSEVSPPSTEKNVAIHALGERLVNIGDRSWKYPSTGLVVAFDEKDPQYLEAKQLFQKNEFSEAGTILISLIQNEPTKAAYHSLLSSVLLSLGDIEQARTAALQAVTLHPTAITHVNLAAVYLANNDFQLAEEHYEKAYQFAPKFFLPLRNLSSLRYISGDLIGAEKYLRGLLKIEPEDSYAYVALAEVLSAQNRLQEAREILEYRIQELEWVDSSERMIDSGMMLDLPLVLGELYRRDSDYKRAEYWLLYTIEEGKKRSASTGDELRYQIDATLRLVDIYLEQGRKEDGVQRIRDTEALITTEDLQKERYIELEMSQLRELKIRLGMSI